MIMGLTILGKIRDVIRLIFLLDLKSKMKD